MNHPTDKPTVHCLDNLSLLDGVDTWPGDTIIFKRSGNKYQVNSDRSLVLVYDAIAGHVTSKQESHNG